MAVPILFHVEPGNGRRGGRGDGCMSLVLQQIQTMEEEVKPISFTLDIVPRVERRRAECPEKSSGECLFEVLHEIAEERRGS